MLEALYIGATGMQAQQLHVDTIANNLVNMNTTSFKKGRINFADLVTNGLSQPAWMAGADGSAGVFSEAYQTGSGVGVANMSKLFEPGDMKKTDSEMDVAIQGNGLLEVIMPDGTRAYTRGGTLKLNADGLLATQAGYPLAPGISIPGNVKSLSISSDGRILLQLSDQASPVQAGVLELVQFPIPGMLTAGGDNLYRANASSGEAVTGRAGEDGLGLLQQGFLESSNVKMVEEMVSLMVAQRAYEASVKLVQASDEMLGMINNLRR
jgi:flagellar basal-body rod protein FlgG